MSKSQQAIFTARDQAGLIDQVLAFKGQHNDVRIRRIARWDENLDRISKLPLAIGRDCVSPEYYMIHPEKPGLTLVVEDGGAPVGQISIDLEDKNALAANLDLWVGGVFVSPGYRGSGLGSSLARAALDVAEAWRREIAAERGLQCNGAVNVLADTEPDTVGDALVLKMQGWADELDEIAFDESREAPAPPIDVEAEDEPSLEI